MRTPRKLVTSLAGSIAVAALALVAAPTAASADDTAIPSPVTTNSVIGDTAPRGSLFGPTSVWQLDVRSAPVNSASTAMVADLKNSVTSLYNGVAAFNVSSYSTSIYTVDATQPRIDVKWDNCQRKTYTPPGLLGVGGQFTQVPLPAGAVPAKGTDGQLTVYSPQTDQLWEFWRAKKVDGVWQACWGGRIDGVSTNPGYFAGYWGAAASGLSFSAGAVGIKDAQAGSIDHALSLQIPNPAVSTNVSWPAQRSDGFNTAPAAIPEGLRFRLDPSLNVDAIAGMTPIGRMVAKAAQKYGFIVTDTSGAVSITAESGSAVLADTGVDPWPALMRNKPSYSILANFPWDKLQALPSDYGKPLL